MAVLINKSLGSVNIFSFGLTLLVFFSYLGTDIGICKKQCHQRKYLVQPKNTSSLGTLY